MPLILEIITESEVDAYVAGRATAAEAAAMEEAARRDHRLAERLRRAVDVPPQPASQRGLRRR